MARVLTAQLAAKALKDFARLTKKETLAGMRQELKLGRKKAVVGYHGSGLGRALWAKRRKGGPPLILKSNPARFSRSGDGFIGGFTARGMAGIIEAGGRTEEHLIKPKRARLLVFEGQSGLVFTKAVRHPGGPVRKNDALTDAMNDVAAALVPTLDTRFARLSRRLL